MEKTIWSYQENFNWNDPSPRDDLYVDLHAHRGNYFRTKMLTHFGLDGEGILHQGVKPKCSTQVLFGGHLGCGKSTELRQLEKIFSKSYTAIYFEATDELDINNLQYSDLLVPLTNKLIARIQEIGLLQGKDEDALLKPISDWFYNKIFTKESGITESAEFGAKGQVTAGIPLLAKVLGWANVTIKNNTSHRETLRREMRDSFSVLAGHVNILISHANDKLAEQNLGPLLFIIDGTDKLSRTDSENFFGQDSTRLRQIDTNLVLCSPINVLLEIGSAAQQFAGRERLPMVKVVERDGSVQPTAIAALRAMVERRLPAEFFDTPETLNYLVEMSGGHPRDLLRLVYSCFPHLVNNRITKPIAEKAVADVASEYQRLVSSKDWADLQRIDHSKGVDVDKTPERLRMLYSLVLLEYNNYWWRSHPLVRELPGYSR